jgi:ferredoxin
MNSLSSFSLCLGIILLASFGCSSNKSAGGGGSQLSVAITTQPATSVQVNKTSTVTATVTNDSSNAGVDWTMACGGSGCGSITTHTASGAAATFTAPSSVPSAAVVITAKSTADATKTANANSITIAGSGISIAITSQPASALQVNSHTTVTALVTADSSNAGVDWSLACGGGACGTIDAHTASNVAANYTAPATVPAAVVVITAKATADATKTANANSITISLTPPPISIAITSQPAAVLQVNGTTTAVATVTNDLLNAGVDWSLACGGVGCGSITAHTASGATATYTAPAAVPSAAVTITAKATADNTKTANTNTVSISLTATCLGGDSSKNSALNGRYAFLFGGFDDATGNRIIAGGSFLADGSGNISSGVVDSNFSGTVNNNTLTGNYCVGADNRGTVVIVPQSGTPITYAIAVGSFSSNVATAGSFIEFDDNNGTTGSRGTGKLFKQDTTAFAAHIAVGTYVLGLYGRDTANNPVAVVGDFTVNASGTITAGQYDVNNAGTPNNILTNTTLSGSLAAENTTTGRFTGTLTPGTSAGVGTGYAFYVVSATELIAIPTDLSTAKSAVSGDVFLQNPALTYSTNGTALTGTAIVYGTDNDTGTPGASDASIGRVTFSAGTINGTFDQDNAGTSTLQHPDTEAYTVSSDGRAPITGVGNPILYIFDLNKGFSIDTKNSIGVGHLEPQSSTSFSNGSYFVGIQDFINSNKSAESGVVTVSGGNTANISQDQSSNQTPFLSLNQMQSLPFTVDGNGHVTFTGGGAGAFAYVISSTKIVVLDTSGSNAIVNNVQQ